MKCEDVKNTGTSSWNLRQVVLSAAGLHRENVFVSI